MNKILTHEHNGTRWLFVEVPSMAFGFDIQNYTTEVELIYMLDLEEISPELANDETLITVKLPSAGKWNIHSYTSLMEPELASEIVGRSYNYYQPKQQLNQQSQYDVFWVKCPDGKEVFFDSKRQTFEYAIKMEFQRLITSLGGSPDKNYVVLKSKER